MVAWVTVFVLLGATATSGSGALPVPTDAAALHEWLLPRPYLAWDGWSGVRESTVAEGGVRVFWNRTLRHSLDRRASHHPVGSAAVRELFEDDLKTHRGWSAMVKVAQNGSPDDWLFFEVFTPHAVGRPSVAVRGARGCTTCHEDGVDFIQSR